jgi:hypothetical protein
MRCPVEIDDTRTTQLGEIIAEFREFRIRQRGIVIPMVGHHWSI